MALYYCNECAKRNSHPENALQAAVVERVTRFFSDGGKAPENHRNHEIWWLFSWGLLYLPAGQENKSPTARRGGLRYFVALKKDRKGQWSIRINQQWRICFKWVEGHAEQVEIVDYH